MLAAAALLDLDPNSRKRSTSKPSIFGSMATVTLPPNVQSLIEKFRPFNGVHGNGKHEQLMTGPEQEILEVSDTKRAFKTEAQASEPKTMDTEPRSPTLTLQTPSALVNVPPPPPLLKPSCHPLEPQITEEVDAYFIKHWPFPSEKAIQKFRDAGFSRVTCCYYPEALNDRIGFGCRLLTLLFLIDGTLSLSTHMYEIEPY